MEAKAVGNSDSPRSTATAPALYSTVDQESMSWFIREGLAQLLNHPASSWVLSDVEVENPSSSMVDREPDVQQSESHGGNDEEVHPCDHVLVIAEEGRPALPLAGISLLLGEVTRDRRKAYPDAQLRQLCLDLPRTPAVLGRHPDDEGFRFFRDRRSSRSGCRDRSPIPTKALAMPSDDGLRANDHEMVLPVWPQPRKSDPEGAIQG